MLQAGQEIAGYKLLKKVGEGGMGQVFLAEQLRLHRQVAVKLVNLDVKPDAPEGSVEPADELTREAEALMALEHPNILSLYDAGRDGDIAYLVMPYIPEGSLQDALRSGPRQQLQLPLAPADALIYIEQAAAALQYAHDRNFIHRDVKPANFLIRSLSRTTGSGRGTKRLHLFLADFGLSKFLAYSSNTTHLSGTPTYMAPEQFQGRAVPASDQYSLAILFFYLLTGELPYRGTPVELMFHHLSDTPPSVAKYAAGIPESLVSVVQRGMGKNPDERFPSVTAMAEAARDALVSAGIMVSQDSAALPAVRPSDLSSDKLPDSRPNALLEPTAVLEDSNTTPAKTVITDDLATARGPSAAAAKGALAHVPGSELPTLQGKTGEGSLPTLAIGEPKSVSRPPTPPVGDGPASGRQPRPRGQMVALAALAAILVIGAIFGSGLLLQIGPFHKSTAGAQATNVPTSVPTSTSTVNTTPTAVPPSAILNGILAETPTLIDLTQGSGPWDGPKPIAGSQRWNISTPSGKVIWNGIITYNAKSFPTPVAISIELQTTNNQEFDFILQTAGGLYYRVQLTPSADTVATSSDDKTYTNVGTAPTTNTTWSNGQKHTLILALDGTRLLFYIDNQSVIDAHITQPGSAATLMMGSVAQSTVDAISVYPVPQGS